MPVKKRAASSVLFILFTTVLIDLIGFGIIIPLVGIYGRHYGATGLESALLGGIYSFMQFLCSSFWGSLSDRMGRRPVLLISIAGLAGSYFLFAWAPTFAWLFFSRVLGGIFAANISTAQAVIADITPLHERARGMGLLGAAFGIGFTFGPVIGGLSVAKWGLAAPGVIAGMICTCNVVLAYFRLPETLPEQSRKQVWGLKGIVFLWKKQYQSLLGICDRPKLCFLMLNMFGVTFCFSGMESTLSFLLQTKFHLDTQHASYHMGLLLMVCGFLGAILQGFFIGKLVKRFSESILLQVGLLFEMIGFLILPFGMSKESYFLTLLPIAVGASLINPSLASLISREGRDADQGLTLGVSQSLASLARAFGPFINVSFFHISSYMPYFFSASLIGGLSLYWFLQSVRWVQQQRF